MAVSWLATYRAVLLLAIVVGLFVLYHANSHRETPGARPLALLVFGSLLYVGVKLAVSAVRGTPAVFVLTRFNPLAAGLATVGFFVLVVEYTGIENPVSKRTVGLLLIVPAIVSSLVWIDIEYLWVKAGSDPGTVSGYAWEVTSIAIANQLYMNALLVAGVVLLGRFAIQSDRVFRLQATALLLAPVAPVIGNLTFYFGVVPVNLAPVMFVLSAILISWTIIWTGFLDLVPVGRNAVVSNLSAGVVTVDSDHRVIDTNESSRRIFDLDDADSLVGRHIDVVFADHPSFREQYWSLTDGDAEKASRVEFDGRYLTIEAIPLQMSAGRTVGHTVVIRDVTDQALREQELEQSNEELERSNEKLEQFASMVSHDLRNPLSVIFARVGVLNAEGYDQEHVDSIEQSATRMEEMITDLLTLARTGESIDSPETVSLRSVAEDSWETVQQDGTEFDLCVPEELTVEADRERLMTVFENFFRNTRDHNDPPLTIHVGVLERTTADGDSESLAGFFVEDDGDGIPTDERDQVFDHGYSTSRNGTGFGLAIVKEVVRAHNWSISVCESEDGGARFEITDVEITD